MILSTLDMKLKIICLEDETFHFNRPTFSFVLLLFLFAQFIQRQLIEINRVQIPGQYLSNKKAQILIYYFNVHFHSLAKNT